MPQFADPATYRFSARQFRVGCGIFLIGLLKKCLLADPLAPIVAPGFAHPAALPLFAAWHVALCLFAAALFRFLRLFRHGDRAGAACSTCGSR